jgi:hypothetical protein
MTPGAEVEIRPIERDTWDLFEHPFGPDGVRALVRLTL